MKSYQVTATITLNISQTVVARTEDIAISDFTFDANVLKDVITDESPFDVTSFSIDDVEAIEGEEEPEDDRDRDERRGYYD